MKHISKYFVFLAASLAALTSCSSEDAIMPQAVFVDPFIIPADKTDAESVMRREFYERNGIHLLLSDVVGETVGADGQPYTEMIDLGWNLTSDGSVGSYEIITDEDDQCKAIEVLERYILPHITGEGTQPYSVYPVYEYYNSYGGDLYIYSNRRCTLINVGSVLDAESEDEITDAVSELLYNIADQMLKNLEYEDQDLFYVISEEYHGEYIADYIPEWVDEQDIELLYEYGFIDYYKDWYDDPYYDSFPGYSSDWADFVEFVMYNDPETVYDEYGDYEIIIQKYEMMRSLLAKAGFTL